MIKELIYSIWIKITDPLVRKQSLSALPDGTFICTSKGKSHHLKHLLEGLTDD